MITKLSRPEQLAHVLDVVSRTYMRASAFDMGDFLSMMPSLTRMLRSSEFIDIYTQHKVQYDGIMHGRCKDVVERLAQERKAFFSALASIVPKSRWPLFLFVGRVERPVAGGQDVFEFRQARDVEAALFDVQWERREEGEGTV